MLASKTSGGELSDFILYVLMTIAAWGTYGVLLHVGRLKMDVPGAGGSMDIYMKAYLWVGVAYFLTAVLAPLLILLIRGAGWTMSGGGIGWSLIAGTAGAIGALGVLLAFGNGGKPAVVMSLVFAGAPIVNAAVAMTIASSWSRVQWPFLLGIVLAATGAFLVVQYKPEAPPKIGADSATKGVASASAATEAASNPAAVEEGVRDQRR